MLILREKIQLVRGAVSQSEMKLKPIKIFREPVEFKPLIPKLSFITNKTMWTGHIRVAMREIPEEDYQLILNRG